MADPQSSNPESNRDKVLRGEVVKVTHERLREMQRQAIRGEGAAFGQYHWHWAAVVNELLERRADDEIAVETTARLPPVPLCKCGKFSIPADVAYVVDQNASDHGVAQCDSYGVDLDAETRAAKAADEWNASKTSERCEHGVWSGDHCWSCNPIKPDKAKAEQP